MKSFSHLGTEDLYWIQPTLKRSYELRAGSEIYATMQFATDTGSLAVVKTSEREWTFKRVGFFKARITVREKGQEEDLLVYYPHWGSAEGMFELIGGETYVWKLANYWATKYQIVDSLGKPLVVYTSKVDKVSDLIKDQAKVELGIDAFGESHIMLLVAIGWYLIVLQQEDVFETAMAVANKAIKKKH